MESLKTNPAVLPNYDFSQQPDSPMENYDIEECTMTDSQIQRYDLLNKENTIFLSSQLENYEFNTGNPISPRVPQSTIIPSTSKPFALKRPSPILHFYPNKRRKIADDQHCSAEKNPVIRELHWKLFNLKKAIFTPLSPNAYNLELQLRNNFDVFYLNDQQSIKRLLNLNEVEWKDIVNVLKTLNGYVFDVAGAPTVQPQSDVLHRIMHSFMRSIPSFVQSRIQFQDFMGHVIEVTEQPPLKIKCTDSSIDPEILERMKEFKKELNDKKTE